MNSTATVDSNRPMPGEQLPIEKMPGHWLLARMGKRVLRPGGMELTRNMLDSLGIESSDTVVELAPGLGATARLTLDRGPTEYVAVERDGDAAKRVEAMLQGPRQRCVVGTAAETGLENEFASVVYGEAMLTMQTPEEKARIVAEAYRILRPGGQYGIHELALKPDGLDSSAKDEIQRDLSAAIHVGARPLTISEWIEQLEIAGFEVDGSKVCEAPMHLLELKRVIQDEGLFGALRIAFNVLRTPAARRRVLQMRQVFRRHQDHLGVISIIARKPDGK